MRLVFAVCLGALSTQQPAAPEGGLAVTLLLSVRCHTADGVAVALPHITTATHKITVTTTHVWPHKDTPVGTQQAPRNTTHIMSFPAAQVSQFDSSTATVLLYLRPALNLLLRAHSRHVPRFAPSLCFCRTHPHSSVRSAYQTQHCTSYIASNCIITVINLVKIGRMFPTRNRRYT
jgi:hypothetical protein